MENYKNIRPFDAYSILVTEDCNLACEYCYERTSKNGHNTSKMTKEVAKQSLNFMFSQAKSEGASRDPINIGFFGGEPTLNIEIIDYMCSEALKMSKEQNKEVSFGIITNATYMNEKVYEVLKKYNKNFHSCQLSIDGPNDIQDRYRVTKSGKGSFKIIEKNIKYWKTLFGDRLNIHGCLNAESIDKLFDSYKFFHDVWEIPTLWFLPIKDPKNFTNEHVKIYDRELGKIYDYIMEKVRKDKSLKEIEYYAPLNRALRPIYDKMPKPCGAGDGYATITAKGDIYPCHHIYYIDDIGDTKLGNIYKGINLEKKRIWAEYDADDMIGCEECEHPSCYRCIAENYDKYKTPFVQIKGLHCDFMHIDLKYQNKIRKEIEEMGLLNKDKCKCNDCGDDCQGNVSDCVGKQGNCDNVVSVEECVFDRGNCDQYNSEFDNIPDYNELSSDEPEIKEEETSCYGNCKTDDNTSFKTLIDDMIKALIKYHNSL